jgi:hypothetical protein
MEDHLNILVQNRKFKKLVVEQPTVALKLLACIAAD